MIRELTAEENSNAIYGIIDGHHWFNIDKETNADTILAKIESREPEANNDYLDKVLAYRLNESSIKMSPIDKGKVIYELSQQKQCIIDLFAITKILLVKLP